MSLQTENRDPERRGFARSDADALTTALRSDLFEHLRESVTLAELRKGQMPQRASLGTWSLSARLEPPIDLHAFILGLVGSGIVLDDSSSTAVLGSEWRYVGNPQLSMEQFYTWSLLSTGSLTSISGPRSLFAATAEGDTNADAQTHPAIRIDSRAAERLGGHDRIISEIGRIATELSAQRGLPLVGIAVRPAWSHEYEETGIVVEVTLQCSPEDRFAYWEALGEATDTLAASIPAEQSRFLDADVSLIVERV